MEKDDTTTKAQEPMGTATKPPCRLTGVVGNVMAVIGTVKNVLKAAGQHARASEFVGRAFCARSYQEVLGLCFEYVEVS